MRRIVKPVVTQFQVSGLAAVVDGDTAIKINLLVIVLGLLVLYCGEPSDKDE